MTKLTQHASIRMQQRGIDNVALDMLFEFGQERPASNGVSLLFLTKETKKKLKLQMSKHERVMLEHQINAYLILSSDGDIVTVGHRTRRMMKQ